MLELGEWSAREKVYSMSLTEEVFSTSFLLEQLVECECWWRYVCVLALYLSSLTSPLYFFHFFLFSASFDALQSYLLFCFLTLLWKLYMISNIESEILNMLEALCSLVGTLLQCNYQHGLTLSNCNKRHAELMWTSPTEKQKILLMNRSPVWRTSNNISNQKKEIHE